MGIQDRDYTRSRSYIGSGWSGFSDITPVVKWLVIANAVVFFAQILSFHNVPPTAEQVELAKIQAQIARRFRLDREAPIPAEELRRMEELQEIVDKQEQRPGRFSYVQEWFALDVDKVLHGQVWRLVTHAFCHDTSTPWHILFNMIGLWWFGPALESMRGSREFLLFYFGSLLAGAFALVGLDLITGVRGSAIGASAAVMGVFTLYTYHFPRSIIYIFWVIPLEMRYALLLATIYDLHPVLLQLTGQSFSDGVAHVAHLGGMAFAFLYGVRGWHLSTLAEPISGLVASWSAQRPRRRSHRNLRVFDPDAEPAGPRLMQPDEPDEPDDDRLRDELDEVLRKMHEVGRAGLTPAELAILDQASARFARKRRPE
ncbi:MAG TPA: rhomboid family intramembrane serine protease [Gemmataceae bacterium]|nr:rhomboid family intramembrane serine protease [Gemmataceae bacterium]